MTATTSTCRAAGCVSREWRRSRTAGVRMVPLLPGLHGVLLEHRAMRRHGAEEPVFPTRNATRNTPNNVLKTIVVPVREEANRLLAEREQEPIAHLTPHTLRRTFASILALCEVHPRRARQLMGHEDSRTTAGIYEQDIDDSDHAVALLEQLMGCDLAEAHDVFAKRRVSVAKPARDEKGPPWRASRHSSETKLCGVCRDFEERLKGLEPSTFCMARSPERSCATREMPANATERSDITIDPASGNFGHRGYGFRFKPVRPMLDRGEVGTPAPYRSVGTTGLGPAAADQPSRRRVETPPARRRSW